MSANYWENNTTWRHYFCETCDKSFKTDDDLLLHEADHEICGRDGCEFTAHPKIIAKHKKMQHDSGLYKKIGKLYTEEEIAKWIEERKKRYPSKKVIEEKKALEVEKNKRGERIKEDKSKFNKALNKKNRKKTLKKVKDKNRKSRRNNNKKKMINLIEKATIEETKSLFRNGVPAFSGIGNDGESLKNDIIKDDIEISDEEWQTSESKTCNKISINNSLSILASAYDSNDDETDMELPPDENKENNGSNCEEDDVDLNCLPDEVKTVVVKDLPVEEENDAKTYSNKNTKSSKKSKMSNIKKPLNKSNPVQRRNLTLLEKLLKNEIRHERNAREFDNCLLY
ncbi:Nuclear fragile X mental retardation-interacting protein, putative [Pediculus humanus corporis]|uniref:Nuclear fragile X mental retardation-interacting protein, putative n=1 Tax=Pediculus humanus subsp. corporis TaxID=121224 RepID=E0VF08_PEDHC|nr:Nuclear fragile X mental retardation-interacting protein, putative [Pediculus humanus corporis]EEB11982.1 Nuclear fragile X mental retardation-interacting protein, putative [Pediculus humanus corporis]